MSPLGLKLGATALTLVSLAGSAGFVSRNVKNVSAPLHPAVVRAAATPAPAPKTRLHLDPSVRASETKPAITFTYVS